MLILAPKEIEYLWGDKVNFGTNLRNLRLQRELTQQELAKSMNISQASITAYETGVREPSFEVVRRFAEYFHVAPSVLMPFSDYSDGEYAARVADALKQNEKMKELFDLIKDFGNDKMDTMLSVARSISSTTK